MTPITQTQIHDGERYLVLGDMGEVGIQGPEFHEELGRYAAKCGIEHLLTFGDLSQITSNAYLKNKPAGQARHYSELAQLNQDIQSQIKRLDHDPQGAITVLVKGSRFMRMERVVEVLQKETKTCS